MKNNEITEKVIGAIFKVSNTLGSGFLEKVYENASVCLNYLRATGLPICLLISFYNPKVEIRRIIPYSSWQKRKN